MARPPAGRERLNARQVIRTPFGPGDHRHLADTAAEFALPYHVMTLPAMVHSHFRLLRRLGGPDRTGGVPSTPTTI